MTDESSLGDNNNNNNIGNISNTVTELSKSDIQWDFTSECNTAKCFNSTERRYHSFKFPLQCTNAPQRVLMYYREDYFPFVIYAHYGVDAVAVKGKLYFSMCALFHSTYGSNFILAAIAFTTCTSPVKRYWVYDRAAKRFLEWTDKQISSFSCVPSIDFDENSLHSDFKNYLICSRKLYDKDRQIKFISKNAAKAIVDIPKLDKFEGDFDEI
jgi:hypothetical protein